MAPTVVVCGTGTEVGKTHVACCLLAELRRAGQEAVGLKPVESGLDGGVVSDARRLAVAGGWAEVRSLYGFGEAVSPHLAARRAGVTIEASAIVRWVEQRCCPVAVVETAGGLMTPLGPGLDNLGLVRALAPGVVVLVGENGLGVLHEVSMARAVLEAAGLWGATVVALSEPAVADASSETNGAELVALGVVQQCVVFPRAAVGAEVSQRAAGALMAIVETVGQRPSDGGA